MPPEGYDTVTLPEPLVENIDEIGEEIGQSRATVVHKALNVYQEANEDHEYGFIRPSAEADSDSVDFTPVLNRIDDLENTLPRKLKEELR